MAAKRDVSVVLVPSRQVTRRQARAGRPIASCFAETGFRLPSRRINEGGRPLPLHFFGGNGMTPGGHRLMVD
jgi:hypothetical protein